MTKVFAKGDVAAPGTHALIIGIGSYPHLLGGSGALTRDPLSLRQLTRRHCRRVPV